MEFSSPELLDWLQAAPEAEVNALPFGVVALDGDGRACMYSDYESRQAELRRDEVLNCIFFEQIAPCMNNLMVAGRFADARHSSSPLDATLDYVLAFRSRVARVKLRLLYAPGMPLHYLLIQRAAEPAA